MPPISPHIPIAIGVVTLLGRKDNSSVSSTRNRAAIPSRISACAMHPLKILKKTAATFFFKTSICLYNGTAKEIVAGVSKKVMYFAP